MAGCHLFARIRSAICFGAPGRLGATVRLREDGASHMNQSDIPRPETQPPRDRLSRLSEASLRINETLEFDNVLQEVVESARTLTGARYGMMATLDQSGGSARFFSSATTAEERRSPSTGRRCGSWRPCACPTVPRKTCCKS